MELIADRFVRLTPELALDLATARRVWLHMAPGGDRPSHSRWAAACARQLWRRHPRERVLVDFGLCGRTQRFEAYACEPWPLSMAITIAQRRAFHAVRELLDEARGSGSRPSVIAIEGPPGSGRTTLVEMVAREARLRGYVPITTGLLAAQPDGNRDREALQRVLRGRHLFIVHDGRPANVAGRIGLVRALLRAGADSARPHLLIGTGLATKGAAVIEMDRLPCDTLAALLESRGAEAPRPATHVSRAAARADGRPGPFLLTVDRALRRGTAPAVAAPLWRVAEAPAVYHVEPRKEGPMPGEIATGAADDAAPALARARELVTRGRHAAAERSLREQMGKADRRKRHDEAAHAALWLGQLLLRRGRAAGAAELFDASRRRFDRLGAPDGCVLAAAWQALAWTDEGRLCDAESLLKPALCAAEQLDAGRLRALAQLALARCLFWQGRYRDARLTLEALDSDERCHRDDRPAGSVSDLYPPLDLYIVRETLLARVAVGERALQRAAEHAGAAHERARAWGRPLELAVACAAAARVQLALMDAHAGAHWIDVGLAAAAEARAPLVGVRLRLLRLLVALSVGRSSEASAAAARLRHVQHGPHLPRVLRMQVVEACARAEALGTGAASRYDTRARDRFIRETGAHALTLVGGSPLEPGDAVARQTGTALELLELLELCRRTDDERTALAGAAGFVRERLNAAAVGVFARTGEQTYPVAWTGARAPTTALAKRAADLGQVLPPAPAGGGTEMAVPVTCGEIVGAVTCRLALDARVDGSAAAALLNAVAAAMALHVRLAAEAIQPREPATPHPDLVGSSRPMLELRQAIARAARTPFPVLVEGESGSGKELVARAIHEAGARRLRRFLSLNCAALPDDLLEAELFGHARGAFTGALAERAGLFEQADGGTLLMDEVGELSPRAQAKLLRVLQEGEIRRLGDALARRVDVRIVAATNRSLSEERAAGRFRQDLLYRLDVIRIAVPPLRDRLDDVPRLAEHFWRRAAERTGTRATLAPGTIAALARYDWPGNVRELQNVLAALAATAPPRGRIGPGALPATVARAGEGRPGTLDEARRVFETRYVRMALARAGGRRSRAAADLGLTRQGLAKLMARLAIAEDGVK